jgi:pathogenesis-related protein 1
MTDTTMTTALFRVLASACLITCLVACGTRAQERRLLLSTSPAATLQSTRPPNTFAEDMLDAHNQVRATANPMPMPPLVPLEWSEEAAKIAETWAAQCIYKHNPYRLLKPFGENSAASTPGMSKTRDVVKSWAAEAPDYTLVNNSCAPGKVCGHYTQLVWRITTHVGCAVHTCTKNSPFGEEFPIWEYWVCNYLPQGNYFGQRPY